jgi:hypothetical protein
MRLHRVDGAAEGFNVFLACWTVSHVNQSKGRLTRQEDQDITGRLTCMYLEAGR